MKGYEQTSPEVEAIGQLNFHGDGVFTPNNWYQNIKHNNGKTYIEAIVLLGDIVSWYLPIYERDELTGRTIGTKKKFKADKLQRTYDAFAEHYGLTKDQARNALRHLSSLGLIELEFRTVDTGSQKLGNVLFVGVVPNRIREYTFTTLSPQKQTGAVSTKTDRCTHRNRQVSVQKPIAIPTDAETYTDLTTDQTTELDTENNKERSAFSQCKTAQLVLEMLNQDGSVESFITEPIAKEEEIPPTPLCAAESLAIAPAIEKPAKAKAKKQKLGATELEIFRLAYNEGKPKTWSRCDVLDDDRVKLLQKIVDRHDHRSIEMFQLALQGLSMDSWWSVKKMSIDSLIRSTKNLIVMFAEKASQYNDEHPPIAQSTEANAIATTEMSNPIMAAQYMAGREALIKAGMMAA